MAVNVDKLIQDSQKKQAEARKQAAEARREAEKDRKTAKAAAESKVKSDYADTLKPRLQNYEDRLRIWANKIARGDKLSTTEQKEFDRLVKDYKSLNATIDKAIKDSYDIVVKARKTAADDATKDKGGKTTKPVSTGPTGNVTLQATKTADQTAKDEADAAAGKKTPGGKGKGTGGGTQGVMPTMPTGGGTATAGPGFNPALARAGEEASMGATPNIPPKAQRDLESILRQTEFWYDLPDYIFKTVPKLGELLVKAVNEGWDDDKFLSQAKLTTWWQQNSAPIRTRIIARAKFNELTAGGQDASKTEYAMDTATIKRSVQARARQMGANLDENAINQVVGRIYDGFLENDTAAIDSFIAPYIGKVSSIVGTGIGMQPSGYTGQALQNFQALQAVAKANGLTIKDILPKFSVLPGQTIDDVVLQKLATGELDINRLAQDARMIAAQGTPDYVKGLLQQGYDLEQIYAPYKNVMSQILEINPDEIDLNDGTLRGAIGMDKEMNIYDFKKALRKDSRWQYTEGAREEVANSVLGVLRDFGFQG
jgi:hypothetical protein